MSTGERFHRRPGLRKVVLAVVIVAVAVVVVQGLLRMRFETGVEEFVPRDDPYVRATTDVAERFGGDPIIVVLESAKPGDLLSKEQLPALLRLEGELAALPDVAAVYGPGTVLNQIAGQAQDLLAELAGYRDGLRGRAEQAARRAGGSQTEVAEAGRRATEAFDERYANLLTQGMPGGLPTLHNQTFVDRVIFNDGGDPRPQWDFLVPRTDTIAILVRPEVSLRQSQTERLVAAVDETVGDSELVTENTTVTGIPPVVVALGEQLRHEIPLLGGAAVLLVGAWFLLTGWTRRRYRLLPLATTLGGTACTLALAGWLGRPLALTAVAFLPVLLGIGSDFMTYLHRGVGPRTVLAAALASAAGFGALVVAPVPAVADLGASLAVGLVITVALSLAVHRWLPTSAEPAAAAPFSRPAVPTVPHAARVCLVGTVLLAGAAGWALLPSLALESDFRSLASDLEEYDDAQRIERVVGASGEVVVVVRGDDVLAGENLAWMGETRREVIARHGDVLKPVLSPPDLLGFLGADPTDAQVTAALRLLPAYLSSSVVTLDRDMAIMTFGVNLDDVGTLSELRHYLGEVAEDAPGSVDVELAGLPMVAVSAHEALQQDRLLTAVLGIIAAGAALLVLLPERRVALLAMLSAAAASGVVMLGMSVSGQALTPMTAGLGSLTAAVACEFTVVLAHAQRTRDRRLLQAVDLAAAASATGYCVLALSDLGLIRGFGLLLALTVGVALVVSRLLTWAVWASPREPARAVEKDDRAPVTKTLEVVG